jgi:hypothetical protein
MTWWRLSHSEDGRKKNLRCLPANDGPEAAPCRSAYRVTDTSGHSDFNHRHPRDSSARNLLSPTSRGHGRSIAGRPYTFPNKMASTASPSGGN